MNLGGVLRFMLLITDHIITEYIASLIRPPKYLSLSSSGASTLVHPVYVDGEFN